MANWKVIALVSGNIEAVSGTAVEHHTSSLSGKGKLPTKLKPLNVQRKPTPELT